MRRLKIAHALGTDVFLHWTWIIFVALIVQVFLTSTIFSETYLMLPVWQKALTGVVAAGGLAFSILLHELGHVYAAKHSGIQAKNITLFVFGGMATLSDESKNWRDELYIASSGPAVSAFLSMIFLLVDVPMWPEPIASLFSYLFIINLVLVVFNLIPAFPSDGGRMLYAILWRVSRNRYRSLRFSGYLSLGFVVLLGTLGVMYNEWYVFMACLLFFASIGTLRHAQLKLELRRKLDALWDTIPENHPQYYILKSVHLQILKEEKLAD